MHPYGGTSDSTSRPKDNRTHFKSYSRNKTYARSGAGAGGEKVVSTTSSIAKSHINTIGTFTSNSIISGFPSNLELCNERVVHQKVQTPSSLNASMNTTNNNLIYDYKETPPTILRAIPRGKKCVLWFRKTAYNLESVIIMRNQDTYTTTNSNLKFAPFSKFSPSKESKKFISCFNPILASGKFGTIVYGTLFSMQRPFITTPTPISTSTAQQNKLNQTLTFFSVEDVLCFQGMIISPSIASWNERLSLIGVILNNVRPTTYLLDAGIYRTDEIELKTSSSYNKSSGYTQANYRAMEVYKNESPKDIIIMSPIMVEIQSSETRQQLIKNISTSFSYIKNLCYEVSYAVFGIQIIHGDKYNLTYLNTFSNLVELDGHALSSISKVNKNISGVSGNSGVPSNCFYVKAQTEADLYRLYKNAVDEDSYIGLANIPDYKTSVMMNSLFRNIKENLNLDLLEESDDEDDFEDIREDKYVDTSKIILMECQYVSKFRSWIPRKVIE